MNADGSVSSSSGYNRSSAAMSSTVFPCGHITAYTGVPPNHCPSCGIAHQNISMSQTHLASHTHSGYASSAQPIQSLPSMKKPKPRTMVDWLDEQINRTRKRAFDA